MPMRRWEKSSQIFSRFMTKEKELGLCSLGAIVNKNKGNSMSQQNLPSQFDGISMEISVNLMKATVPGRLFLQWYYRHLLEAISGLNISFT